jgi:hypothetical protein
MGKVWFLARLVAIRGAACASVATKLETAPRRGDGFTAVVLVDELDQEARAQLGRRGAEPGGGAAVGMAEVMAMTGMRRPAAAAIAALESSPWSTLASSAVAAIAVLEVLVIGPVRHLTTAIACSRFAIVAVVLIVLIIVAGEVLIAWHDGAAREEPRHPNLSRCTQHVERIERTEWTCTRDGP